MSLRLYEAMFILDPHLTDENLKNVISGIEQEINKLKGKVLESHPLGKKRMAYAINKQVDGYYHVFYLNMEPASVDKLNKKLKLNESVFRSLFLTLTEQLKKDTAPYLEAAGSRAGQE